MTTDESALPGFAALTDELYAGSPAVFVVRRDELAKQARSSGDRVLATAIKALRRPTVGAWYLNLASRGGLTSLRELVRLGRQLRQTQESGDFATLRELAAQRGPLETRVLRDLAAHLAELGVVATPAGLDEARVTFGAVLADPAVEALLTSGRLDRPYAYAGFGDLPQLLATRTGVPARDAIPPTLADDDAVERQAAAEAAARRAREQAAAARDVAAAEQELAALSVRRDTAEANLSAASDRVRALAAQLSEAHVVLSTAHDLATQLATEAAAINARLLRLRGLLDP